MPDFPIVDSHVHLLDPERFGYAWTMGAPSLKRKAGPADLFKAAAPMKIESFVFAEVDVDYPQHLAEAEWVQKLSESEPKLKGMVCALPLEKGMAIAPELEKLRKHKIMRGVRRLIQNQKDPDFCIKPDFIAGLKLLAPYDLSFDICVFHHHLPNVIKMVEKCPEVRFVLDHIGKPGIKAGIRDPWRENMKTLASHQNVFCKISGVANEADHAGWTREQLKPYIAHAVECFGFDCSMYGGDWHVMELAIAYPEWVGVVDWVVEGASAAEKQKLFRETAIKFYRLDR